MFFFIIVAPGDGSAISDINIEPSFGLLGTAK